MSKHREPGWYWVFDGKRWFIAEWLYGHWWITCNERPFDNDDIREIDERPVKREQLDDLEILRELNRLRRDGPESTDPEDIAAHGKRISELETVWNFKKPC